MQLNYPVPTYGAMQTLNRHGENFQAFCNRRADPLNKYTWTDPCDGHTIGLLEYQVGPWRVVFEYEDGALVSWGYERKGKEEL